MCSSCLLLRFHLPQTSQHCIMYSLYSLHQFCSFSCTFLLKSFPCEQTTIRPDLLPVGDAKQIMTQPRQVSAVHGEQPVCDAQLSQMSSVEMKNHRIPLITKRGLVCNSVPHIVIRLLTSCAIHVQIINKSCFCQDVAYQKYNTVDEKFVDLYDYIFLYTTLQFFFLVSQLPHPYIIMGNSIQLNSRTMEYNSAPVA